MKKSHRGQNWIGRDKSSIIRMTGLALRVIMFLLDYF